MIRYLIVIAGASLAFCLFSILLYLINREKILQQRRMDSLLDEKEKQVRKARHAKQKSGRASGKKWLETIADELYVAGIALRAQEYILIWVLLGLGVPVLAIFLGVKLPVGIALIVIGSTVPVVYVKYKRRKRLALFDKQLPDALGVLCNSLRAGLSFQTAMQTIANEMDEPISREFGRVARECSLGMPLDVSLEGMVERTGSADLELICSAVLIQRQIGGNLAVILENISGTISERIAMRREVHTLTSSGTMSGYIVGGLPVFLMLMLMILNPDYISSLFTTKTGNIMLVVSAILEMVGFVFVRKIIHIKM